MLKLTDSTIKWLKDSANKLKGSALRTFMAQSVQQIGRGGASAVARELQWNRGTIRKGKQELKNGPIEDKFNEFVDRMPKLEKWSLTISPGYSG